MTRPPHRAHRTIPARALPLLPLLLLLQFLSPPAMASEPAKKPQAAAGKKGDKDAKKPEKDAKPSAKDSKQTSKDAKRTGKDAKSTGKDNKPAGKDAKKPEKNAGPARPAPVPRDGILSRGTLGGFAHVKFTLPSWRGGRTAWCLIPPTAKRAERITLVLFCHGMHALDYAKAVSRVLPKKSWSGTPIVYLGIIDIPAGRGNWTNRWEEFDAKTGRGPDLLFAIEREARALLAEHFTAAKRVDLVFSGFSGGHRVMDGISRALVSGSGRAGREAKRVKRLLYHDTFYDPVSVDYVPALLKKFPHLSIRATVSHAAPRANGGRIAKRLKAKESEGGAAATADGRFQLRAARTHWDAYHRRLAWSLTE